MEDVQIRGPHFISTLPADLPPIDDDKRTKLKRAGIIGGVLLLIGIPSVLSFYIPKHIIKASQEIIMAPFAIKTQHGEQFGNVSLSKNPTPTPAAIQKQNQSTSSEQNTSEYTSSPASYYPASEVQQVMQPQGNYETQNTQYMPFSEPITQEPNTQNTNPVQEFFFYFFQQEESNNEESHPTATPVPTKVNYPTPTRAPTLTKTPTPTPYVSTYQIQVNACKGKPFGSKCDFVLPEGKKVQGQCLVVNKEGQAICIENE
jgi:hypothetical protein